MKEYMIYKTVSFISGGALLLIYAGLVMIRLKRMIKIFEKMRKDDLGEIELNGELTDDEMMKIGLNLFFNPLKWHITKEEQIIKYMQKEWEKINK